MGSATLPAALSAVPVPIQVNEVRCYDMDELAALTGMSAKFWYREIADGRIQSVRLGQGSRNDKVRVMHTVLLAYLRDHTEG